jgi:hypothetical protein
MKDYPWYTPYQFAGNKPIWAVDLDGLEEKAATFFEAAFGSPASFANPRTPLQMLTKERLLAQQRFADSRAGRFIGGAWNFSTGLVGAIGSVTYMAETGGIGAAVGGTLGLQLSLGEMGIGTAQMLNALFSTRRYETLENSSSIPGLIAYGADSKYAPFIDALGQFTPTMLMAGGVKGLVKSGGGVIDALKQFDNAPGIKNAIGVLDQISDTQGFVLESVKLVNTPANRGRVFQTLNYGFSFKVKKGDTLGELAKKFNTTVEYLRDLNRLKDENKIEEGQVLKMYGRAEGFTGGGGGASGSY